MNESIYNLIPKPRPPEAKHTRYRSKYDPNAPLTGSTFGLHGTTATIGRGLHDLKKNSDKIISSLGPPPNTHPSHTPGNFLRKNSGKNTNDLLPLRRLSTSNNNDNRIYNTSDSKIHHPLKPSVPHRHDRPVHNLTTDKNYITANAVGVILSSPPREEPIATTNFSSKNTKRHSNYGKVPPYLSKVRNEIRRETEMVESYVRSQFGGGGDGSTPDELTEDAVDEREREELILALKTRWDAVNAKYQKYCHRVTLDTPGDIKRKETQERELRSLEEDIELLSRSGRLVVRGF